LNRIRFIIGEDLYMPSLLSFLFCCLLAALPFGGVNAQTSILFCGGIENNLPMGVSDRYYPDSTGAYLYAYYSQPSSLDMKQIGMEVYKKGESDYQLVGEKRLYSVKPKWKYTYIRCHFTAPGLYKVKLYDKD